MASVSQSILDTKLKVAWREKYISEGVNQKSLAMPKGCYRGLWLSPAGVPNQELHLLMNSVVPNLDKDQFAIYADRVNGWQVSIRESAVDVAINCAGLFPVAITTTFYVYIEANYTTGAATTGAYTVADTDPHQVASPNYNPKAIMIGRFEIIGGSGVINFNPLDPAFITFAYDPLGVYRGRTYPKPTPRATIGSVQSTDEPWGYLDSLEAWRIPSYDQKGAMNGAAGPSLSNPFAVEDETTRKYFAETCWEDHVLVGNDFIDLVGDYYVGKDGGFVAAKFFDLIDSSGLEPFLGDDNGQYYISRIARTASPVTLVPADADAWGFYINPRVYVGYNGVGATYAGNVKLKAHVKQFLRDLDQTGADGTHMIPDEGPRVREHTNLLRTRRPQTPAALWPLSSGVIPAQFEDAMSHIVQQGRGPAPRNWHDSELCANAQWDSVPGLSHPYNTGNSFNCGPAPTSVPVTMAAGYVNGARRVFCYSYDTVANSWMLRRIDPVTGVSVDYDPIGVALPPPAAGNQWDVLDMASDGEHLYIRFSESGVGPLYDQRIIAVECSNPNVVHSGWIGAGNPNGVSLAITASVPLTFQANIIVADASHIAVNGTWQNLFGGAPPTPAIMIHDKATGLLTGSGSGDSTLGLVFPFANPTYPMYGLCSDGVDVFFTVYSGVFPGGTIGFFRASIANPAVPTLPAWGHGILDTLIGGVYGLVYDGHDMWIQGMNFPICFDTKTFFPTALTYFLPSANDLFYTATFDGANLWLIYTDTDPTYPKHEIHKVAVARKLISTMGVYAGLIAERFSITTMDEFVGCGAIMTARPCFDGEDVWFGCADNPSVSNQIRRVPLSRWR